MKKNLEILIAALILLNVFTLFKLNSIQNLLDNEIRYAIEDTEREVSNFTSNINSLIEKQTSIIDSYEVTFGDKLNPDLTAPVKLSVVPKEYTDGTNVSLLFNDKNIAMEKDGAAFSGTVDINIFEAFKPIVVIEQNGVQRTESIDEYYDLQHKYILNINGGYNGKESYRSDKYIFNGNIDLQIVSQQGRLTEDVKIIYDVNGKTVKEQNAELSSENDKPDIFSNFVNIDINEQIDLKSNDKLTIYAVVKDNLGLNYKYVFKYIEIDSDGNPLRRIAEWTIGTIVEISDKNGNVLYTPDYLKNKY